MKTYDCAKYTLSLIHLHKQIYKNSLFHNLFPLTPITIQYYSSIHVLEVEKATLKQMMVDCFWTFLKPKKKHKYLELRSQLRSQLRCHDTITKN